MFAQSARDRPLAEVKILSPLLSVDQKQSLGLEAKRIRLSLRLTQHELAMIAGVTLEEVDLFEYNLPMQVGVKLKILRELWNRKVGKR
jgi:DNA-binding transcriptional regulator YiaG